MSAQDEYEAVIGLEVHVQLLTETKLFCGCMTSFGAEPNTQVCPVCLGLPGALPALNQRAVELAVRACLALGGEVQRSSVFARKQYFYADLPKGYQLSQHDRPLSLGGGIPFELGGEQLEVPLTRIHLEEDAGKSVHGAQGQSLVDLNRAGTPLIEIVTEPALSSSVAAAAALRELRSILLTLGVNDGRMAEGSLRCDANVSVRPVGSAELGTRSELKNLNSMRFVQRAIDVEIARQVQVLRAGGRVVQETRAFDPETGTTRSLRGKEDSHDYRYFPDPDLPPLRLTAAALAAAREGLPALPSQVRARWQQEHGLSRQASETLSAHPRLIDFFEAALRALNQTPAGGSALSSPSEAAPGVAVKLANLILTEVLRGATEQGLSMSFRVTPEQVAELVLAVEARQVSGKQAKEIFQVLEADEAGPSVAQVIAARGLRLVADDGALSALVTEVLAAHPRQVAAYQEGNHAVLGYLVGQLMRKSSGQADPRRASELLKAALESEAGS